MLAYTASQMLLRPPERLQIGGVRTLGSKSSSLVAAPEAAEPGRGGREGSPGLRKRCLGKWRIWPGPAAVLYALFPGTTGSGLVRLACQSKGAVSNAMPVTKQTECVTLSWYKHRRRLFRTYGMLDSNAEATRPAAWIACLTCKVQKHTPHKTLCQGQSCKKPTRV